MGRRTRHSAIVSVAHLCCCLLLLVQSALASAAPARPAYAFPQSPRRHSAVASAPRLPQGPARAARVCQLSGCAVYLPLVAASSWPSGDTQPPSAPTGLRAISKTDTTLSLAWDAATDNIGVAGYSLYSSAALLRATAQTTLTLTGLAASTTYTLSVDAHDLAGNYSPASAALAVSTSPPRPPADAYEPDESPAQARPIAINTTQHHAFSVPGDQDWVVFSAVAGQTYVIETFDLAPGVDTYLELYDQDGTTLLAEDGHSGGERGSAIQQSLTKTGSYYLRVRQSGSPRGSPSASYDLRLRVLDSDPPTVPLNIHALSASNTRITLAWDAATDNVGVAGYAIYRDSQWLGATDATSFTVTGLAAARTYSFQLQAYDANGNRSQLSDSVLLATALPPDPAAIAPPIDQTVAGDIAAESAFLYSGDAPVQTGVAPGVIQPARVAVLRGRVLSRAGVPLAGVHIEVRGHAEYGETASRADGAFDLAVNGGGVLTLDYWKDGYLSAQRQARIPWRDYVTLPQLALVPLDPVVSTIALGAASVQQLALGSPVSDTAGMRQALLIFPAHLSATLELPGGGEQPLTRLHVRATEYSVGPRGPAALPGPLPPNSAYTYAVDYSADEVMASGARQLRFSQPVLGYVENFLGLRLWGALLHIAAVCCGIVSPLYRLVLIVPPSGASSAGYVCRGRRAKPRGARSHSVPSSRGCGGRRSP